MPIQLDIGSIIVSAGGGLIAILIAMVGRNVRMLWEAVKELREMHAVLDNRQREESSDLREHCSRCVANLPSRFVLRDEIIPRLDRMETEIKSMIGRLFDELKGKVDK